VRVKGTFHSHSTLSHDGKLSIPELARFFRERGYQFLCLTEHAEDLDSGKVERMLEECAAVSAKDFLMLPGNEFICMGDVHLLGLGAADLIGSTDPVEVARAIRAQGGFSVLAHPRRIDWQCPPEVLRTIDAIEIWNVGYDGKYLPAAQALESFRRMRAVNQELLALPGHDFHRRESFYPVGVEMNVVRLERGAVLAGLREGCYRIRSPFFSTDAAARVSPAQWYLVRMLGRQLDRARRLRAHWQDSGR
jgi:hypothetical protein